MGKSLKLAIVGGDERQAYLARLAQADGHSVRTFALERAENVPRSPDLASCLMGADAVLLPVPVTQGENLLRAPLSDTKTDIMQVLDAIPSGTLTLGGAVPFRLHARAVQNGVRLTDCLAREELAIRNAVPTCEGALQIAMEQTDRTIQGARALVVGAGRIGFLLAQRLHALGAEVTVPTIDGRIEYKIPEGTQTGTTFRLKGKGIPYVNGRSRGDQYVTVVVETPTRLTREQKDLLRKFEEATSESAQPKRKKFFEKLRDAFDK